MESGWDCSSDNRNDARLQKPQIRIHFDLICHGSNGSFALLAIAVAASLVGLAGCGTRSSRPPRLNFLHLDHYCDLWFTVAFDHGHAHRGITIKERALRDPAR